MVRPIPSGSEARAGRRKASDRVSRELEGLILRGGFAPGDRLPSERLLAEQMSVSRPTLREALHRLEARGLVHSRQGGGTFVRDAAADAITDPLLSLLREHPDTERDFLEFRAIIEQQVAYWAALRATPPDIALIEQRLLALECVSEQSQDLAAHAKADAAFHLAVAESAHNSVLLYVVRALLGALRDDVYYNRKKLAAHRGSHEALRCQHRDIFEAVKAGDPGRARGAACAHIDYLKETIQSYQYNTERQAVAELRLRREQTGGTRREARVPT